MTLLEKYYNKFNEDHRLSTRHGLVEFKTSLFYIEQAIDEIKKAINKQNNEIKILDDGAGTGKYSIELHNKGYDVTAVELVKRNLDVLRNKHLNIKTWQGDARNLSFLEDNSFDITLIFGPLYHLHSEEDKLKVFSEATRITKNNGIILAAYVMNEYSVISYCFKEHKIQDVLAKNGLSDDFHTVCTVEDLYDYVRIEDINKLNKKSGLKRIKLISSDGPSDYMRRELNEMTEEEFSSFLKYHLATCERPELLGAGSHTVDILKVIK